MPNRPAIARRATPPYSTGLKSSPVAMVVFFAAVVFFDSLLPLFSVSVGFDGFSGLFLSAESPGFSVVPGLLESPGFSVVPGLLESPGSVGPAGSV